jgi:hypothetical protein
VGTAFDARLAMPFLGNGLALSILASAASNLSFSTFIFSPCYYGGCGGIPTPETCSEHVYLDYKSGPFELSGTHPRVGVVSESGIVASRPLMGERSTTTQAAILSKGMSQRLASCFLNSRSRVSASCVPRAHRSIFSCISPLFLSPEKSFSFDRPIVGGSRSSTLLRHLQAVPMQQALHGCINCNAFVLSSERIALLLIGSYYVRDRKFTFQPIRYFFEPLDESALGWVFSIRSACDWGVFRMAVSSRGFNEVHEQGQFLGVGEFLDLLENLFFNQGVDCRHRSNSPERNIRWMGLAVKLFCKLYSYKPKDLWETV